LEGLGFKSICYQYGDLEGETKKRQKRARRETQGLGEIKTILSEVYVFLVFRALWAVAYRA
jgi:hypothetical protein